MHDHPDVITKKKRWRREVIPNSIAKRIVPDILSVLLGAGDRGGLAVTLATTQVPAAVDTAAAAGRFASEASRERSERINQSESGTVR
jgi:hypothetical protein